jgi:biotin carboxyl carrier protein
MVKITANNRPAIELSLEKGKLTKAGNPVEWDLVQVGEHTWHILYKGYSFLAEILKADFEQKTMALRINGHTYQLEAKDEMDLLLEKMGMSIHSAGKASQLKAPMPGLILEIKVAEGQQVKKGDPLFILEAMKMENVLKSPVDAIVQSIRVNKGENVEKNHVLAVF